MARSSAQPVVRAATWALDPVGRGRQEGARLTLDRSRVEGAAHPEGNWVGPAVFEDVTPDLSLGREWAERSRAGDPEAVNYLLIWNCLWRAGGSIVHGHMQVSLARGRHYAKIGLITSPATMYRLLS